MSSLIRRPLDRPPAPKFLPRARAAARHFLPFYCVLRAGELCVLLRASRALAVRGKRSQRPCMMHLLLFHQEKSTSTPSSLSPLSLCHNFVRSELAQRTVPACPPCPPSPLSFSLIRSLSSLSHVLVKKRQFDCTASPPATAHIIRFPSPPHGTNKQARPDRANSAEQGSLASKKLSLKTRALLSNPRSVGFIRFFRIANQELTLL